MRLGTGQRAEPGKAGGQREMVREDLGTSGQLHLALHVWRPGSFLPNTSAEVREVENQAPVVKCLARFSKNMLFLEFARS